MDFKLVEKLGSVEHAEIRRIVQIGLTPQLGKVNAQIHWWFWGSHVYDYAQSRQLNVGGNVSEQNVNLYDYERSRHFTGKLP
ncbi:MAG: hypothetical protein GW907_11535 [Betaproteobacteria bacterium]|nr:hypothetical protein [Betaproteobacteria bacterium]NCP83000.1 hypothetical protein [Rhodoferax sp.]NCS61849.1 hypothetical protein [Rhodoferax sp.]PIZ23443.1 MAG: hypothetical protein COY49_03325 [Comamonadaceae bacterium CG_4_10_14_0_8_um_filter_57_29]